eukprot:scaffold650949_cov53-Prasinocladus_malaysianus.AAC.1
MLTLEQVGAICVETGKCAAHSWPKGLTLPATTRGTVCPHVEHTLQPAGMLACTPGESPADL